MGTISNRNCSPLSVRKLRGVRLIRRRLEPPGEVPVIIHAPLEEELPDEAVQEPGLRPRLVGRPHIERLDARPHHVAQPGIERLAVIGVCRSRRSRGRWGNSALDAEPVVPPFLLFVPVVGRPDRRHQIFVSQEPGRRIVEVHAGQGVPLAGRTAVREDPADLALGEDVPGHPGGEEVAAREALGPAGLDVDGREVRAPTLP